MTLDLEDITRRLLSIKRHADEGDNEAAHSAEDELYRDFIEHVSRTAHPELAKLAALVLSTSDINFARWCA